MYVSGYAVVQKGYQLYHRPTKKLYMNMDVIFHEYDMYFSLEVARQWENISNIETLDYD